MRFLERIPLPRRLPARLWLLSLPSALLSFERRQKLPKMPIGRWRLLGLPLMGVGLLLCVWASRRPAPQTAETDLRRRPGTVGGLLVLSGVALLLRSLVLAAYSFAIALGANLNFITVEEPRPGAVSRNRPDDGPDPPAGKQV